MAAWRRRNSRLWWKNTQYLPIYTIASSPKPPLISTTALPCAIFGNTGCISAPDHEYAIENFQAALFVVHIASSSSNIVSPLQEAKIQKRKNVIIYQYINTVVTIFILMNKLWLIHTANAALSAATLIPRRCCDIPLLFFAVVNSLAFSTSAAAFLTRTFSFFSSISSVYMIQETKSEWVWRLKNGMKREMDAMLPDLTCLQWLQ